MVSGIGMQTKIGYDLISVWLIAKFVIWAVMGAAIVILKRRIIPAGAAWALIIILGTAAAYLGVMKPGLKMKEIKAAQAETSLIAE